MAKKRVLHVKKPIIAPLVKRGGGQSKLLVIESGSAIGLLKTDAYSERVTILPGRWHVEICKHPLNNTTECYKILNYPKGPVFLIIATLFNQKVEFTVSNDT